MARLCFWTAANGDYVHMARAMVLSARKVGMAEDFLFLGDREVPDTKFVKAKRVRLPNLLPSKTGLSEKAG